MIIQGSKILSFLNFSVVYYVMQLGRCAFLSLLAFALVVLLRKTLPKHRIFLKGAVWSFFLPVLFAGKMKFFYQHPAGVKLFSWWTRICMNHAWVCWLYLWGMVLFAVSLILKRRKTKRLAAGLEKRVLDLGVLYVTEMPVSPFAIGVFCPKIIMPEIFLKEFDREEIQTILLHETTHIRLGHLLFYLLWDIMRVLLWINPLLIIGTKFFREDLEEICDWVTIRQSKGTAYDYGRLLVKSMRLLQAEKEEFNMFAAFAGDREYQNILQRVTGIARYRAYRRSWPVTLSAAALLCAIGTVFWIQHCSYGKCNEDDNVFVYGYDGAGVTFSEKNDVLKQMISYDDRYVYVDREAFEKFLKEREASGEIFIVFGGFYKLPGLGGMGYSCRYAPGLGDWESRIPYEKPKEDWLVTLVKMM